MDKERTNQLEREARKAEEARSALRASIGNSTLSDAFEYLRRDLNRQMSSVKATETATIEKLVIMWQMTDALERWFVKTIQTGDAAVLELQERKKFKVFG